MRGTTLIRNPIARITSHVQLSRYADTIMGVPNVTYLIIWSHSSEMIII